MVVGMNVDKPENDSEGKLSCTTWWRKACSPQVELFEASLATLHATQCFFPNLLFPDFQTKRLRPAARTQRSQGGRTTEFTTGLPAGASRESLWELSVVQDQQTNKRTCLSSKINIDDIQFSIFMFSLENWRSQTLGLQGKKISVLCFKSREPFKILMWKSIKALCYWNHWIRWCSI